MKKFLGEFKEFALRGNVMDLAIGVIIGAAFQAIVDRGYYFSAARLVWPGEF